MKLHIIAPSFYPSPLKYHAFIYKRVCDMRLTLLSPDEILKRIFCVSLLYRFFKISLGAFCCILALIYRFHWAADVLFPFNRKVPLIVFTNSSNSLTWLINSIVKWIKSRTCLTYSTKHYAIPFQQTQSKHWSDNLTHNKLKWVIMN